MKLNIRGDKIKVTKSIKDYITEKLAKLDKYFDNPKNIDCKVIIRVKNLDQIVEVTVPTSKFTLRAEERHADLYAAVDLVVDKLERQIRKNKTKIENRKKQKQKDYDAFVFDEVASSVLKSVLSSSAFLPY